MPKYSVCLSFAGEQRPYVKKVAEQLKVLGIRCFYDEDEQVDLWGKDLTEHLDDIYRKDSQFCVMFVSKEYVEKMWTIHERRSVASVAGNTGEFAVVRNEGDSGSLGSRFGRSSSPARRRRNNVTLGVFVAAFVAMFVTTTFVMAHAGIAKALATTIAGIAAATIAGLAATITATESSTRRRNAIAAAVVFPAVFLAANYSVSIIDRDDAAAIATISAATVSAITSVVVTKRLIATIAGATALVVFIAVATLYATTMVLTKADVVLGVLAIAFAGVMYAAGAAIAAVAASAVVMAVFAGIWKTADHQRMHRRG